MKIYTKTGDRGTTALFTGTRVPKYDSRIEAYGTLDELNAWLGLLRDQPIGTSYKEAIIHIQEKLFTLGAILATEPQKDHRLKISRIEEADLHFLEQAMDAMNENLPPMTNFILPGGHTTVSYCHVARTICRRAERMIVHLHEHEPVPETVLAFINRLSDYLFVLGRALTKDLNAEETKWISDK
ncbi:MAG: cob(I)yrinic acid a,c-diamide adenosyltransferase [Bacteroidota bacterium]